MRDFAKIPSAIDATCRQVAERRLTQDAYYADDSGKVPKHALSYGERLDEEHDAVRSQVIVQICLELPLFQPMSMVQARQVGNCGEGHSAYMPKDRNLDKNYHLIVDPDELDSIIHWLVVPSDGGYWLKGWMEAIEAKTYPLRDWIRPDSGLRSVAHWVPRGKLHYFYEY